MAPISQLSDRQRARFQQLRQSGQGNKARAFKNRALGRLTGSGDSQAADTISMGPKMSKQFAQGEAYGQKLINQFLPDINALGTLDASRSAEMQNLINQQQAFADLAGTRSADSQMSIDLAKQGLGGLSAAENDALRARGFEGLNRAFQGGQRALARFQGRGGAGGFGSAAGFGQFRDLARDRMAGVQGLERDIMLENINIQNQRRNALANLIGATEGREFGQQQQALQGVQALTTGARQDELAREQFNLGQQDKLLAGQQALMFGGMGLVDARRNAIQNARLAEEQNRIAIQNANAQAEAARLAAQQTAAVYNGGGVV